MNYCVIIIALLLYALPSSAAEPAQALLAEITRPNAPILAPVDVAALIPMDETDDAGNQPAEPAVDLFTLEELKGTTSDAAELALPDVNLPLSDIPLALNSKVEYFLYYFQTSGRQSFSRWPSRSSRFLPMIKTVPQTSGRYKIPF